MRYRLEQITNWIVGVALLGGLVLIARDYPITTALTIGMPALGILILTALYDYDYWKRRYLRRRHSDVLLAAATIVNPHLDPLAQEMGKVLKWDGRWDYNWETWSQPSREFVNTHVIPALSPDHQRIVADWGLMLRAEIESELTRLVFVRAQQLGLVI